MMKMKICNVHFVMHADEYYNILILFNIRLRKLKLHLITTENNFILKFKTNSKYQRTIISKLGFRFRI